jgi:hypothetical protein
VTLLEFHIPVPNDDKPIGVADVHDLVSVIDDDDDRAVTKSLLFALLALTPKLSMTGIARCSTRSPPSSAAPYSTITASPLACSASRRHWPRSARANRASPTDAVT